MCMLQAMRVSPMRAMPNVACCISMGRLAVFSDNKAKVSVVLQQDRLLWLWGDSNVGGVHAVLKELRVRGQVKLVKDAREQAVIALRKEPDNDLAQHLMGRCGRTRACTLHPIIPSIR